MRDLFTKNNILYGADSEGSRLEKLTHLVWNYGSSRTSLHINLTLSYRGVEHDSTNAHSAERTGTR